MVEFGHMVQSNGQKYSVIWLLFIRSSGFCLMTLSCHKFLVLWFLFIRSFNPVLSVGMGNSCLSTKNLNFKSQNALASCLVVVGNISRPILNEGLEVNFRKDFSQTRWREETIVWLEKRTSGRTSQGTCKRTRSTYTKLFSIFVNFLVWNHFLFKISSLERKFAN